MKAKILSSSILLLAVAAGQQIAPTAQAAVTFSVTPATVSNTYNGVITLQVNGLTNTETVAVQKFIDLNTNGVIDDTDWLVQQFKLTDGQAGMVIGGVTSLTGALYGAIFIQFIPNIADQISKAAPWAIYGTMLILFMYIMPTGIAGAIRLLGEKLRIARS